MILLIGGYGGRTDFGATFLRVRGLREKALLIVQIRALGYP